jgi:predicted nucleotidyltransferase
MTQLEVIKSHKSELEQLASRYGVSNIRVFGSAARQEERPDSDIDLLISFDKEHHDAFDLGGFQHYSSELLGRRVDLVMDHNIYPPLKKHILSEATPL